MDYEPYQDCDPSRVWWCSVTADGDPETDLWVKAAESGATPLEAAQKCLEEYINKPYRRKLNAR